MKPNMRISFLLAFSLFASAAAADVIAPPTYGTTPYPVGPPVVASTGQGFLTLWSVTTYQNGTQVYGSIADSHGNVLTPASFPVVPHATVSAVFPYQNAYVAIVKGQDGNDVSQVALITSDGRLFGYGAVFPAAYPDYGDYVGRAFNGQEFFTVTRTSVGVITGVVMSIEGKLLRSGIPIATGGRFSVVASGPDFVVVTEETAGVLAQRYAADGQLVFPKTLIGPPAKSYFTSLAIASSGDETAIAWSERISQTSPVTDELHIVTVSNDGIALGSSNSTGSPIGSLQLTWTGTRYLLLGSVTGEVGRGGHLTLLSQSINSMSAAASTDAVLSVAPLTNAIIAATPILTGDPVSIGTGVNLSVATRRQAEPSIASDGFDHVAVWLEQTADATHLLAARIDSNGKRITEPVDLGLSDRAWYLLDQHSLAPGATVDLVVWHQPSGVVARRIDRSGKLLDREPILLSSTGYVSERSVAWDGTSFVVALAENSYTNRVIRVAEDGVQSSFAVFPSPTGRAPSIAWDGSRFLLLWPMFQGCPVLCPSALPPPGFLLSRLSAEGTLIDTKPATVSWPAESTYHIATNGREFVITAERHTNLAGVPDYALELRTVRADGAELQVGSVVRPFHWLSTLISDVLWDGTDFVVAWRYSLGRKQFIGQMHLDDNLSRKSGGVANVGASDVYDRPALATDNRGNLIILTSEISGAGGTPQINSLTEMEFMPLTAPPPAPLITSATGTSTTVTVTWLAAPTEIAGFIIERGNPFTDSFSRVAITSADARSITIQTPCSSCASSPADLYVRMRTINLGGVSEPTAAVPLIPPSRTRRVRPD